MNKLKLFLLTAGMMILTACSEDVCERQEKAGVISVNVTDGNLTRTAYSDLSATFESGDRVGIYCVNASGTVIANNIMCTYDGTEWNMATDIEYNPTYRYYAYAPYVATPYTPDFNRTEVNIIFSAFLSDNSDKFHLANQSTKANFQASDLMIAEGTPTTGKVVTFAMNHKKALAVFEGEDLASHTFTGNIPYAMGDKKYFLMKPSVLTTVGGYSLSAEAGKYITQEIMDYAERYLTFTALENTYITLTIDPDITTSDLASVSYSLDGGVTWTTTNNENNKQIIIKTPTVAAGAKVMWKGTGNYLSTSGAWTSFCSSNKTKVSGNIMSLLYGDNFEGKTSISINYIFANLFREMSMLCEAKNLILPATTLANNCYNSMFSGCTALTSAPELPATTLTQYCYSSMFYNCTSLTTAPELPATILAQYCYNAMFSGCTSLTTAPELPATTLASNCYNSMFSGCTALTSAPELPATTLRPGCYNSMFSGCRVLTTAPELPATTLANNCYNSMFYGCRALTTAPELPATTLANNCYQNMFQNCTALTSAPELPATTLRPGCYNSMFYGCRALTTAPELPATILAQYCYNAMFSGCTSLTTAPELPATTLANNCYNSMFYGCRALTTAPELPATTLTESCYQNMFQNCSSLNYIKAAFTTTPSSSYTTNWVNGVAASGTFYKNSAATWNVTGTSGVPSGWTVETYTP